MIQDLIVTLVAILAAWMIARRVFTAVAPGGGAHDCASCPIAHEARAQVQAHAAADSRNDVKPLVLVRRGGSHATRT